MRPSQPVVQRFYWVVAVSAIMSCSNDDNEVTVDPCNAQSNYFVKATFKSAHLPELSFSAGACDSRTFIGEGKVGVGDSLSIWAVFDYGTGVTITLPNVTSLGEYDIGFDSVQHLWSQVDFLIYNFPYQFVHGFSTKPKGSGKIAIEQLDSDHVKGSFDCVMYTEDGSLVATITNGSFYQLFE